MNDISEEQSAINDDNRLHYFCTILYISIGQNEKAPSQLVFSPSGDKTSYSRLILKQKIYSE